MKEKRELWPTKNPCPSRKRVSLFLYSVVAEMVGRTIIYCQYERMNFIHARMSLRKRMSALRNRNWTYSLFRRYQQTGIVLDEEYSMGEKHVRHWKRFIPKNKVIFVIVRTFQITLVLSQILYLLKPNAKMTVPN